jgi:hypothetical protein
MVVVKNKGNLLLVAAALVLFPYLAMWPFEAPPSPASRIDDFDATCHTEDIADKCLTRILNNGLYCISTRMLFQISIISVRCSHSD